MRLLDLIAQSHEPLVVAAHENSAPMAVTAPRDFARQIIECPLRFVIADDLTRASAELAFADGDRLAGCLDLLRIPATRLWIEWSDAVHQQVICDCGSVAHGDPKAVGRQVGVFLQAAPCGRSGTARTFWSTPTASGKAEVQISPVETDLSLDDRFAPTSDPNPMLRGDYVSVTDHRDSGVADLLRRVRFRFDDSWRTYYQAAARTPDAKQQVVHKSLAAVAHDIPMLLAFFLLLNAKGATQPQPVQRSTLNRKRLSRGHAPLLDHIEVHASLPAHSSAESDAEDGPSARHSPRLHHVRGHLVRREDRIFWRTPHLRGKAFRGVVRSRTVCLSFAGRD